MKTVHITRRIACAGLLAAAAGSVFAQGGYPSKPVKIIVPFAPGGATSAVAKLFADRLSTELGQGFIVDHRGGGETLIGTAAAAGANGDGYTLLVTTPAFFVNHTLYKDADRNYDSHKDFIPVAGLVQTAWLLVTHPSVPGNNLKEFLAYAKSNPGKLNLSSASSIGVLNYDLLEEVTGTKYTVVNYKGQGPATTDLLGGVIQGTLTTAQNVKQFLEVGKVKVLATAGHARNPLMPEIPTFAEQGVPGFVAQSEYVMLAPKNTPADIVARLNAAVRKIQADPTTSATLATMGFTSYPTSVNEARSFVNAEIDRYGRLVKKLGLTK